MNPFKKVFLLFFLLTAPNLGYCDLAPSLQDILTVYFITDIQGSAQVQVLKEGVSEWEQMKLGDRLEEGDRILVGEGTQVVLSLKRDTLIHLDENTEMTIDRLQENGQQGFLSRLKLWSGDLLADVRKHLETTRSTFEVTSDGVVCGVRGTVFEVSSHGGDVQTAVHEGAVHVQGEKFSKDCQAGQTCRTAHGKFQDLQRSPPQCAQRYEAWKKVRGEFQDLKPGQLPKDGALLPPSGLWPNAPGPKSKAKGPLAGGAPSPGGGAHSQAAPALKSH